MRLKEKVALITGGARGIGKATAEKFLKEGARVAICDINMDGVNEAVDELKQYGEIVGFEADVTKKEDVDKLIQSVIDKFGKLDVLINNAGITADATFHKMAEEQFDRVIAVNLKGVYLCGQAAAKVMREQGFGVILNASSVVGLYGNFGQTNYAATKWGVIGMAKTWAKELGKYGVRVNCVAPGFIATEMVAKMPEKVIDMMKGKAPLGRLGTPEDVANIYAFLASDEASFVTGSVYSVDGGVVL